MNVSTKQKQAFRHSEQTCNCQELGWVGEGKIVSLDYQMQIVTHRMSKQEGHITVYYVQYPVMKRNGKEYEKEYIYPNHLAVLLKLTKCFKSTILQ